MSEYRHDRPEASPADETGQARALLKHIDPASRESGLVLDRDGVWHHESTPVTHERLARALTRWLERDQESGRFRLRIGEDFWAWVDVEDAPYQANVTSLLQGGIHLERSDGVSVDWRGDSIQVGPDDAWYVDLGQGLEARLTRGSMVRLADHLVEDDSAPAGISLRLPDGATIPFRPRQ